jgi:predicted nucleic acid-binding Zn ribbon protein
MSSSDEVLDITCSNCGQVVSGDAKSCKYCAFELAQPAPIGALLMPPYQNRNCPSCGAAVSTTATFCGSCGAAVGRRIRKTRITMAVALTLVAVAAALAYILTGNKVRVSFEEKLLSTIPSNARLANVPSFNPTGTKVAYAAGEGNPERVTFFDGDRMITEFLFAGSPVFSRNGRKLAFIASNDPRSSKGFVVVDGKRGPMIEEMHGPPIFNSDGSKLAYAGKQSDKWYVFAGDDKSEGYDQVDNLTFSRDGNKMAYVAKQGNRYFVVTDYKRGEEFDSVKRIVISRYGDTVAYIAGRANKEFIVINDRMGPPFEYLSGEPAISEDGQKVAYLAHDKDPGVLLVTGDKKERLGDWYEIYGLLLSPDGSKAGYKVKKDGQFFVVIGANREPNFDHIEAFVFSPDGKRGAYTVRENHKEFVVVGDKRGPAFDHVESPYFSADSNRWAYRAKQGDKWVIVTAGVSVGGDKITRDFDYVDIPVFSRDGSKVGYGAVQGKELWWKVIDTQ